MTLAVLALFLTLSLEPALAGGPDGSVGDGQSGGGVLMDHARRGLTLERLDGLAAESPAACAAVCDARTACTAWTWRSGWTGQSARCDLHGSAATPFRHPGAVTGLSRTLTARINTAADREPTSREIDALTAADS